MNKKAIKKPSTLRHIIQALFFAITNGYVTGFQKGKIYGGENKWLCVPGLNCYSCPGAMYACPIGSLQAVLNSSAFKFSCYVFGFIMVVGAIFGRLVCGFLCPFGLVQDLLYKIPFPKKVKNLKGHKYLKYLRYVVLIVFVFLLSGLIVNDVGTGKPWYCEYICPSGTLFASIPLVALNQELQEIIGWRYFIKLAILIVTLLLAVVSFRPFCKYLCPLGAMYGVCNPISMYRLRVNEEKCVSCGACQKACGMDIKVWQNPNSTECIRCGECKAVCPTGAITSSFGDIKAKLFRDLPKEQEEAEQSIIDARKGRSSKDAIAPEEKKNGFSVFLGVIIYLLGLIFILVESYACLSITFGAFNDAMPAGDFFIMLARYGSAFIAFIVGVLLCKSGNIIVGNKGRLTATIRGTRLFAFTSVLNLIVLLLSEIEVSPLAAILAAPMVYISLAFILLLLIIIHYGKKNADEPCDTEAK